MRLFRTVASRERVAPRYGSPPDEPGPAYPLRSLSLLVAAAAVATLMLLHSVADGRTMQGHPGLDTWVDTTDSSELAFAAALSDTTDSTLIDSTYAGNFYRAGFYVPRTPRDPWTASPVQRTQRPLYPGLGSYWTHQVTLDSTRQAFIIEEYVGDVPVRYPLTLDLEAYRRHRLDAFLDKSWRTLSKNRDAQRERQRQRGGLGFNIVVPGGRQSAFTTIFGKPQVDLRVNGQADITAGFDYRKSDQQVVFAGKSTQVHPEFKLAQRLGITGTIGDKLRVDVNWDTNNQFDFQNHISLQYEGYEDEIIQNFEAGNVNLSTPSRLIRGGQSLFGIKNQIQLGGLELTTVLSQQEGQSNTLSIEGGSQTTEFELKPTDYVEKTHYFLAYYFRNRWEDALRRPPQVFVSNGFETITDIEVWRLERTSAEEENVRQAVALVDLGEPQAVVDKANEFTQEILPGSGDYRYPKDALDAEVRDGNAQAQEYLMSLGLSDDDFQVGRFKKLRPGTDYSFDRLLGYLSLTQRIQDNEALAVAFRYRAGQQVFQVGDFASETGGSSGGQNANKLVLKLLKPVQLRQPNPQGNFNPAAWYLELRNIYKIPGRGQGPNDFELQVEYQPPGSPATKVIPDLNANQRNTLLQLLGLDRLNADGAEQPDDIFDFLVGFTIDPANGEIIFPYLEPFGGRIEEIIDGLGQPQEVSQQKRGQYAFKSLYTQKKELARRQSQFDVYRIRGAYRGATQDFYDLRAFSGLVEGSVVVTSGGSRLTENTDYTVDYHGGTVTIINPAHLTSGRNIEIDWEQNSFHNLQKKTLLGARADYVVNDQVQFGSTLFSLNQKSPIDKFRIGEEPISNLIWGVDGQLTMEPDWLTRAVDALPFIQTRAPSSIRISGEFAQLRPGASQTTAFERTRKRLEQIGRGFKSDEQRGISYLDDFEGFENTFSIRQPGGWHLSSAPDSISLYPNQVTTLEADSLRTNWRGSFAWYTLNENVLREVIGKNACSDPNQNREICQVAILDVFPQKDITGDPHPYIQPLDVYFNPHQRGPYNYTRDLAGFLADPRSTWGGMVQRLPEGYTDFATKNIEFIEFILKAFPEEGGSIPRDAKLYVDLGSISEDVIPNGLLNTEDGLTIASTNPRSIDKWGRTAGGTLNSTIDVDDGLRRTEDLGLDGLASYSPSDYDPLVTEQEHFRDFLDALDDANADPRYRAEAAKARHDPSGDDFFYFAANEYFENREYYPNGASVQERHAHYFPGTEINSFTAHEKLAPSLHGERGNSRIPDTEDLNLNSAPDTDNSYFQYELPLSKAVLDSLAAPNRVDDFVVTEIKEGRGWYQIRIPVRNHTRRVGNIQDFSLVESIRVWTTGHDKPLTIRFPVFELVGAQWQKSQSVALERELPQENALSAARMSVSSINNEENDETYKTPNGTIISLNRHANSAQFQNAREQAMVLRAENLMPGKQRAIFKTYNQGLDLLKYSNLRMFSHMHGELRNGLSIESSDKVHLFMRLGANETKDYYEYEMPLTPSSITSGDADALWQTNQTIDGQVMDLNSINIVLGTLNQLKVSRDEQGFPADSVYWSNEQQVSLSPSIREFSPPGTRIGIKGTPSLGRINTIVIGVRNPADSTFEGSRNDRPEDILEDVTVWINELRVAGYDETNGWSALANADLRFADFIHLKANWRNRSDGFGGLESTIGEREQVKLSNWSVTTDVNLDQFIPERYGWTIPASVQISRETQTPRFAPNRGDIRLVELVSQIENDETLEPEERERKKDEAIAAAQTKNRSQSFNTRIQKSRSDSRLLRNTIDGLSLSYSYSNSSASNPSQRLRNDWRWSTSMNYRLNVQKPRTLKPFWFLQNIPVLGILGGLDFNYTPQSITAGATASRRFSASQDRRRNVQTQDSDLLPELVEFPMRQTHALSHRRNGSIQYNPFLFLNLGYSSDTNQSLNALGVDTLFTVIRVDSLGHETFFEGKTTEEALAEGLIDDTDRHYEISELNVVPASRITHRVFADHEGLRTEQHNARLTTNFRPRLNSIKWLNWISLQDVVYGAQFSWRNGPVGQNTGARVGNARDLRGGVSVRLQDLFRKIPFYVSMEKAQQEHKQQKEEERNLRRQQREEAKAERRRLREEERQRREEDEAGEGERGDEAGEPGDAREPDGGEQGDEAGEPGDAREPDDGEQADDVGDEPDDDVQIGDPGDQSDTAEPEALDQPQGRRFPLPMPNPASLGRSLVLALTGIRDFTITYSSNKSANSNNVGEPSFDANGDIVGVDTPYSLLSSLRGEGPPIRYRFGLDDTIPLEQRILDLRLQVSDALSNRHQIQGRTSLNPSQSLQINVTLSVDWSNNENITYKPDPLTITRALSGSNRATTWAFKANYLNLFEQQLETYQQDAEQAENPSRLSDENGDGRVVLTNQAIVSDFQKTYLSTPGTVDKRGFLPFPMPNWQVTYSGLGDWPILRRLVNSASVRHGYSADYSTNYSRNLVSDDPLRSFNLSGREIVFAIPEDEVDGIRLNERFQPLVGVDLSFEGNFQTTISWEKSTSYTLSTTNFEVSQNDNNQITATMNYAKSGMKLPFFPKINNRIRFSVTLSKATLKDQRLSLRRGLTDYIEREDFVVDDALGGDNISVISASTRYTIVPRISYQFSNRVSADFTLRYENYVSEDSRQPSYTNINGGFNFRVSIAN